MKALLDTHVLLRARLLPGTARLVATRRPGRLAAGALRGEQLGKLDLGTDVRSWTGRAIEELQLELLSSTGEHAAAVEHLPPVHCDPFDRLLVAQARSEGAVLLTADRSLLGYGDVVHLVG